MFPIFWGLLQSIVFTVFSNAGGVGLSKKNRMRILTTRTDTPQGWNNSFALGSSFWIQCLGGCVTGRLLWSQRRTQRQRSHCGAFGRSSGTSPSLAEVVPWSLHGGLRTWVWYVIAVRPWALFFFWMFPLSCDRVLLLGFVFKIIILILKMWISGKEVDKYSQVQIMTSGKFACNPLKACSGYPF